LVSINICLTWHRKNQPMEAKKTSGNPAEQINMQDRAEGDYWTEKLGITRVKLKAAVNAVGTSAKAVEAYLKKK
jgi:hypothetical protein